MPLDPEDTITKFQSSTVRNALGAVVLNLLAIVAIFTGKTFDIDFIKSVMDTGLTTLVNVASAYLAWRAFKGRVNATQQIATPEKQKE